MIKTGFFGGSFNPIHLGHISMARQMLKEGGLDEVWFSVTPQNPFKRSATDLIDDSERLEMVRKALEEEPSLTASDYEFHLPKPSFTWSTLQHLLADYPDRAFSLIIGADNWLAFDRWARPDYILAHCPILIYPRLHCPIDPQNLPQGVRLIDTGLFNVSSTEIRQRAREGKSLSGLVPESIIPLVKKYYGRTCGD